jgi:hypothetical protein
MAEAERRRQRRGRVAGRRPRSSGTCPACPARCRHKPGTAGIPAYRLAQDVAIEKILAALAATRDGWATARDSLTGGPCQVPTADARDGRRGNQPWSVITTPVSA